MHKIVQQALVTTRPLMDARRQQVMFQGPSEPLMVDADPVRLEQVFVNLFSNAAKYTPEDGEISASIERIEQHASPVIQQAVVRIRDNGIGIAPEMLTRVFDLFVQADQSVARSQGGLGIGLSLARSLVELHGGRLEGYSSGLGQGSEFVVYLPLLSPNRAHAPSQAADPALRSGTQSTSAAGAQRVLIVDDNPDIVESTSTLLRLSGHLVKVALDAREALQIAASFVPTTIFMDLGMPGVDGYQLCKKLREVPATRDAMLVAVTGYSSAEVNARAKQAGFDRCVVKPVDLKLMNELLGQKPG
jgi:two-component system CheB/CheR fusion protein